MNKSEIIAAIQALVAVISCKTVKSDVIEKANDKISYLISLL